MHMLMYWTNKMLSADVKLNSAQKLCQITCYPNISSLTWYKFVQTNCFRNEEKIGHLMPEQVIWPRRFNISGQGGPTWWVIHHILEAVIQAWTGTAWTRTRTSSFSTSFRFCFCSEVSELHGWSPDGHAKICEGVMTADPNREHVGPSSRVHSCFFFCPKKELSKKLPPLWFHGFFGMSAPFNFH